MNENTLKEFDIDIWNSINREENRQNNKIELIASENFVSGAVMEAMGSPLTNKYAEGYPFKRYYGGCDFVDEVERMAIDRAKELFGAEHANVQPHSGSQANIAVYFALLELGDTILAMNLAHGGHLTHGSPVNISGKNFNIVPYGVDKNTYMIDYDEVKKLAIENKPKLIIAGASAYARTIDFERFKEIADSVGAYFMVDMAHIAGLVAAKLHPDPIKYADIITTTTHKTLRGPRGGMILCKEKYASKIDKAIFPGTQGGPLMHVIAAKAVCFKEALSEGFVDYQKQTIANAKELAKCLVEYGFNIISGGTDNHLMMLDLRNKGLNGRECEGLLDEVGIACNKNMIPFDPESPFVTSGIRLGTPAITTRGMKEREMKIIAGLIDKTVNREENYKEYVQKTIANLCDEYKLY